MPGSALYLSTLLFGKVVAFRHRAPRLGQVTQATLGCLQGLGRGIQRAGCGITMARGGKGTFLEEESGVPSGEERSRDGRIQNFRRRREAQEARGAWRQTTSHSGPAQSGVETPSHPRIRGSDPQRPGER